MVLGRIFGVIGDKSVMMVIVVCVVEIEKWMMFVKGADGVGCNGMVVGGNGVMVVVKVGS